VRGWWNWQTRTFEGRMPKGVQVQVLSRAPTSKIKQMCWFLYFMPSNGWFS
jgi:hypothetical protein